VTLIPDGFEGWVVIRYDVPGEPSLGREGAKTMIKVPSSGSVITPRARARHNASEM